MIVWFNCTAMMTSAGAPIVMWRVPPSLQCRFILSGQDATIAAQGGIDPMIDRRAVLLGTAGTLIARCAGASEWVPIDPAEAGFAADLAERIDQFVRAGKNIHGVIVVRRERIVAERYYEGEDQVRDSAGRV